MAGEHSVDALITKVETTAADATPLDRLSTAHQLADSLRARADELLDHYVDAARAADCSWTEIGCTLGVTKQAAQQRHVAISRPPTGDLPSGLAGLAGPAADAFTAAAEAARACGHQYIRPEHLLLGLLSQPDELAARAVTELGVTPDAIRARLTDRLGSSRARPDGLLGVAPQTKRLLELAKAFAKRLGHNCIRTEHILLAAVAPRLHSPAATLLGDCGVDAEAIRDQLATMLLREAPEIADRLKQRWPLAMFRMRRVSD